MAIQVQREMETQTGLSYGLETAELQVILFLMKRDFIGKNLDSQVNVASGDFMKITCKGKLDVWFLQDGNKVNETLQLKVAPELRQNLFSFTHTLKMVGQWLELKKERRSFSN